MFSVIAWSALSLFMGIAVYFEIQKYDDPLYYHQQSLLSQFPFDDIPSSAAIVGPGCNGMLEANQSFLIHPHNIAHGSTEYVAHDSTPRKGEVGSFR